MFETNTRYGRVRWNLGRQLRPNPIRSGLQARQISASHEVSQRMRSPRRTTYRNRDGLTFFGHSSCPLIDTEDDGGNASAV